MPKVIFNQKGGVGKTTITCNLAAVNADTGKKTLVIDLDPQSNSTQYLLGADTAQLDTSIADFFEQLLLYSFSYDGIEKYIRPTPYKNLDILPAHPKMEELRDKLDTRYKMYKLRDALSTLNDYEEMYFDTPPAYNFFTRSALIAGDTCLIPFDCDDFSRKALYSLLENIHEIKDDHNKALTIGGVIVNQYQSRTNLPNIIIKEMLDEELPILEPYISSSVKIRESHQQAKPLVHLFPKHKLSNEFRRLHQTIENVIPCDSIFTV